MPKPVGIGRVGTTVDHAAVRFSMTAVVVAALNLRLDLREAGHWGDYVLKLSKDWTPVLESVHSSHGTPAVPGDMPITLRQRLECLGGVVPVEVDPQLPKHSL